MRWHCVLVLAAARTRSRLRAAAGDLAFDYSHHGEDWVQGSCASRERQSPIDFTSVHFDAESTGKLSYNYQLVSSGFEIANSGHSIVADFSGLGYGGVTYENSWYNLLNVNLHAESEHTFSGVHKPMEVHMVHKRYDGDALLILAVLVDAMPPVGPPPVNLTAIDPREPDFNPTLQFFTQQTPPVINQRVVSMASDMNQLDLNRLIEGGTYFEYAGSLTAPPCSELVTWFVRRDAIRASTSQYRLLKDALYEMTADFGNYRTTMPLNGRPIAVRTAVREEPPPEPPVPSIPIGPNPRTDREFRAMKWAKDALEVATGATNYIKDLDQRLRKAALAHARALAPDLADMISTPAPPTAAPTGPGGPSASDIEATASHMAKTISEAAGEAIAEAKAQISAEAKKAADAAAARTAQMIADLPAVSPALQKNAPPPAPAPAQPTAPANGTNATLLQVRFRRQRRVIFKRV
jgi:carbonic anhydrase